MIIRYSLGLKDLQLVEFWILGWSVFHSIVVDEGKQVLKKLRKKIVSPGKKSMDEKVWYDLNKEVVKIHLVK